MFFFMVWWLESQLLMMAICQAGCVGIFLAINLASLAATGDDSPMSGSAYSGYIQPEVDQSFEKYRIKDSDWSREDSCNMVA